MARGSKRQFLAAVYRFYEHSGFAMAGAVAYSTVLSIFPFFIFLGALAGVFGGRELADAAMQGLFEIMPDGVARGLEPQVRGIMQTSRFDLLTAGAGLALFFATSAIETLRAALNGAYRVHERKPYWMCLLISVAFVFVSAISALVMSWAIVVGPSIASTVNATWLTNVLDSSWLASGLRYGLAAVVIGVQLLAYHLILTAGHRTIADVLPGILLSIILWLMLGSAYSYYLNFADYSRFYAGLSQVVIALIFFQLTAVIIILGAEFNRGIMALRHGS